MITKLFYNGIEKKIISNLSNSKRSIQIAVAWFTNPKIYQKIEALIDKGVTIEIILCDDRINFTNPKINFQKLIDLGANIRVSKFPNLMHNKFCIIDSRIIINGSYNWTLRAEQFNYENIIISTDKELINDFQEYFKQLGLKTRRIISIPKTTFQSYQSEKEIKIELELEETENKSLEKIEQKKTTIYSPEIYSAIDKAHLLYLGANHKKCISFCEKMITKYPQIPEFYLIIASSYWRFNDNKNLIAFSKKAIAINNEIYEAYNMLGIGYSRVKGKEQLSIKNYNICLAEFPNEHTFLRNRALSYIELENDINLRKFKDKHKKNANLDLELIITTLNKKDNKELTYGSLHSRAIAYSELNKISLAKKDIDLALKKYHKIKDEFELDKNELIEMKSLQKGVNQGRKSRRNTVYT